MLKYSFVSKIAEQYLSLVKDSERLIVEGMIDWSLSTLPESLDHKVLDDIQDWLDLRVLDDIRDRQDLKVQFELNEFNE